LINDGMVDAGVGEGKGRGRADVVLGMKDVGDEVDDGADVADEFEDKGGDVGGKGAAVVAGAVVDGASVVVAEHETGGAEVTGITEVPVVSLKMSTTMPTTIPGGGTSPSSEQIMRNEDIINS